MPTLDRWDDPRESGVGRPNDHPGSKNYRHRPRWLPTAATAFAIAAVVAFPLSVWLYVDNRAHVSGVDYLFGDYTAGVLYPLVGAYLTRRRPDNRVGWVFAATSVIGLNGFAGQYAVAATFVHHGWPLRDVAAWINAWAWAPELAVPSLLPLLFPDGTLLSRRWRPVAITAIAGLAVAIVAMATSHHPIDSSGRIANPWSLTDAPALRAIGIAGILVVFLCSLAGLISLVMRTRAAQGTARAQLQWLMFSVVVTVGLGVVGMLTDGTLSETAWALAMAAIPIGVVVAVVRHQMLDIDLVLNRTIAYGLLTGLVVLAYVVTVSALGEVAAKKVGIAAVAVVALVFASARNGIQRAVDRALFGHRRDPYAVVARLGRRVDAARGPLDALEQMVAELRTSLRLPYVAVVPSAEELDTIESGTAVAGTTDVPIVLHSESLGVLRIGRRHHGERFRAEESSLLHDTARRAGALIQAAVLIADLHASRERIVAAREEERRRLRHDLHDGVGPQLAGLALQLDSLARRLSADDEIAARVGQLRASLRAAVVEVRQVVDSLRPPALDDVGLIEAVRQQVAAYAIVGGNGTRPLVEVNSDPLPALPAAVEVAAYRIVTEAVANAIRHGRPSHCTVSLRTTENALELIVADDGSGVTDDATPGVGLTSMRERAAEVGGTFSIDSDTAGTTVTARLPMERT